MDNAFFIDAFEPVEVEKLLKQSIPLCDRTNLNRMNLADYYWLCADGHAAQIERKQWAELLGEFDVIEEQLRKYIDNTQEMGLITEGLLFPNKLGCETWKIEPNGYVSRKQVWKRPYSEIMAWLWQLDKQGITWYNTAHYVATAYTLVAFYKNSQKEEHTTMRRYIKAKANAWQPNIHVQNLVNLRGTGLRIGENMAEALIDYFGTYWGVLTRSEEELCEVPGVGMKTADALMKAIGRK